MKKIFFAAMMMFVMEACSDESGDAKTSDRQCDKQCSPCPAAPDGAEEISRPNADSCDCSCPEYQCRDENQVIDWEKNACVEPAKACENECSPCPEIPEGAELIDPCDCSCKFKCKDPNQEIGYPLFGKAECMDKTDEAI